MPCEVFQHNIIIWDTDNLIYKSDLLGWPEAQSGDRTGPIPANFPKGYNAFFAMKYEITQEQFEQEMLVIFEALNKAVEKGFN